MKFIYGIALLVATYAPAQMKTPAQTQMKDKVIPLTLEQKTAVDLVSTKMENIQLQAAQMQEQYQASLKKLQQDYQDRIKELHDLLVEDRKALGLPPDASFTGTVQDAKAPDRPAFSFIIPVNTGKKK